MYKGIEGKIYHYAKNGFLNLYGIGMSGNIKRQQSRVNNFTLLFLYKKPFATKNTVNVNSI
jgi:hypothetical protein